MAFVLGKKIGMTQIFKDDGERVSLTLIEAGPCVVLQEKFQEKDGYAALQLGFDSKKEKNIKKPQLGHFKDLGNFRYLREYRMPGAEYSIQNAKYKVGDVLDVGQFNEGDKVKISGISKGKGFQGVVKRYGFKGGPATHGQKNRQRAPGSIGATHPQHVIKGKRMPGRMGGDRKTIKNLEIVKIDKENNLLAINGSVPGRKGTLLEIRS